MTSDIAPGFLISAPTMVDPNFAHTVVLMAEHNENGAIGFIVNRRAPVNLRSLLEGVDEELAEALPDHMAEDAVYIGGPVQRHVAWVIYEIQSEDPPDESSLIVSEKIAIGASLTLLKELTTGERSGRFCVVLGYSGWGGEQLENEITSGSWLPLAFSERFVFEVSAGARWEEAIRELGLIPGGFFMGGGGAQA